MLKQANIYLELGGHYLDQGDLDPAINAFTRVIELEPDNARAYDRRGIAYGRKYYYDEAIRDFDRAIKIDPAYAGAYNNRALSYYKESRFEEALADYDRAIELSPDIGVFYANRGLAHHQRGEFDQAIADFRRAIELDPSDSEAFSHRGETYAQLGQYRKALADFDDALELDPNNIQACASRALLASLTGREKELNGELVKSSHSPGQRSSPHGTDPSQTSRRTRKSGVEIIWNELESIPDHSYCIRLYYLPEGSECDSLYGFKVGPPSNGFMVAYAEEFGWYQDNASTVKVGILSPKSGEFTSRGLDGGKIIAGAKKGLSGYFTRRKLPDQGARLGPRLHIWIHS